MNTKAATQSSSTKPYSVKSTVPPWQKPGAMGFFREDDQTENTQERREQNNILTGTERYSVSSSRVENRKGPMLKSGSFPMAGISRTISSETGEIVTNFIGKVGESAQGLFKDVLSSLVDFKNIVGSSNAEGAKYDKKPDPKAEQLKKAKAEHNFVVQKHQETNQTISKEALQAKRDHAFQIVGEAYSQKVDGRQANFSLKEAKDLWDEKQEKIARLTKQRNTATMSTGSRKKSGVQGMGATYESDDQYGENAKKIGVG